MTLLSASALAISACSAADGAGEAVTPAADGPRQGAAAADGTMEAREEGHHGRRGDHAGKKGRMFERADANADGALTKDEVGEEKWGRISVADANADGRITRDEMHTAFADGKIGRKDWKGGRGHHGKMDPEAMLKRLDSNGDGVLEAAELPERMDKLMAKADANGDSKLTIDELKQHAAERAKRKGAWKDKAPGEQESK